MEQASSDLDNENNGLQMFQILEPYRILQTAVHYAIPENHSAIQLVF